MAKGGYDVEWMGLGYPKRMGSATLLPPPDRDFVRAYYLTSAEHGVISISLSRLKVSRFSDVNDPFELMPLHAHKPETRKLMARFKDSQNSKKGLLCFSKNWTNPMLWSHYADKHKGICLGFDLRRGQVQEIQYEKKRPRMELGTHDDPSSIPKDLQDLLLLTKSKDWEYEQEIRKFINLSEAKQENGLYFLPFDEDLRLKEIILGVRNDLSLEAILKLKMATNPVAVVFKTRLENRGFRIVVDGRYSPEIPTDAT